MTTQDSSPQVRTAHVYGFFRNKPAGLSNLVAIIDCTKTKVLTITGHLNGEVLSLALKSIIASRFDKGMHDTLLCDHYDVTYVGSKGAPLYRDRWVALTPEGIAANSPESERLAKVSVTQVFCQSEVLGGMAHVFQM